MQMVLHVGQVPMLVMHVVISVQQLLDAYFLLNL